MSPTTYIHAFYNSPTTSKAALDLLRPHLPTSLPLYRRIQFGRFFDSTVLLSNHSSLEKSDGQWLLAFVDRIARPETELWMFGSWESNGREDAGERLEQDALVRSLVLKIKELPLPTSLHGDALGGNGDDKDHSGTSRSDYAAHMSDPNVVLFGAVHSATAKILERTGFVKNIFKNTATPALVPNHTYVFERSSLPSISLDLTDGLRWGDLSRGDFALVRSRTMIPRQDATLAILPNIAILSEQGPIAWAFIGLDGSLSTLHVEPEWRERGLAKKVTVKLFQEKMSDLWEEGVEELAHGYVIEGNKASCGVCEAVGGKAGWFAYWVRVNLGVV